jgi:hypothetical protein
MMHLLWLIPLVAGLVAMWPGRLYGFALLVALVCGLIGLAHLMRRGAIPAPRDQHERDTRDVQRDLPPGPHLVVQPLTQP